MESTLIAAKLLGILEYLDSSLFHSEDGQIAYLASKDTNFNIVSLRQEALSWTFVDNVAKDMNLLQSLTPENQETTVAKLMSSMRSTLIKSDFKRHLELALAYLEKDELNKAYETIALNSITSPSMQLNNSRADMVNSLVETSGFNTGINGIDSRDGLLLGNMVSIIGDSGSMKTMSSLFLCMSILRQNPTFTCLYFEKEMPVQDIARRMIATVTAMSIGEIVTIAKEQNARKIQSVVDLIDDTDEETASILSRIKIVPTQQFATAVDIAQIVAYYKPTIWCLDFLTMLENNTTDDAYTFYQQQMNILKHTTTSSNSLSIVLAQIKQNALVERSNKIPEIPDAEFSSKLKQYSAYVFSTFFPKMYYTAKYVPENYYYLVEKKNRHGKLSTINLLARPAYCQFNEATGLMEAAMTKWIEGYLAGGKK